IGECWDQRTATIMILGDTCTRACGFCNVKTGRPTWFDEDEPRRVAEALADLGLEHVVVTSVARDDLPDGGAHVFANTIRELRSRVPGMGVEVLIPDFNGAEAPLRDVMAAGPDILNHNLERYYTPDEFVEMKVEALELGFKHVESGPLVRSSYHARDQVPGAELKALRRRQATLDAEGHVIPLAG